ncbi:DUF2884 family protein [Aliikangiella marina]|uniref:DUF2884 family protein n=1 Tax=Aliikangiella marina TaxID=1712262 RepID=A0A545T1D5_9GAMM|nr:DUF2884 family protein [Aliikangiella marina]TQV71037.1 DUF2884 family protein [Aliikangiella marina]
MKKTLLTLALLGAMGSAQAHDSECRFSTNYDVTVEENEVVFAKKSGETIAFVGDELLINDEKVELTDEQREAAEALRENTKAMVPKIAEIAVEGAELGLKATTVVMTSLFGDDMDMQNELIKPIEEVTEKIKANITPKSFNSEALEVSFKEAFDEEFEEAIETAVSKYSGQIVSNVLSAVFSGDSEELEDFEFRMENLERDIETYVTDNAKDIEVKAEALCGDLAILEKFDTQLEGIDGYPTNGVFDTDGDGNLNFTNLSFSD